MDEELKRLLDELAAAEAQLAESSEDDFMEPDPEDRFYTAAMHVAYKWAELKKLPNIDKQLPIQTGVRFSLDPETGKTSIESIEGKRPS